MRNIKLTIQYDGSRYKGFQRLKDNDNTKTNLSSLPKAGLKTVVPLIMIIAIVGLVFIAGSKSIKLK